MSNYHVPTLNIREAVIRFREAGIQIGDDVMGAGIEQGLYPFAICTKTDKGRRFEIYERLLDEYLAERSVSKGV